MSRCPLCMKRNWFWQCCLTSRFGYGHYRCIDARIRQELQELYESTARAVLFTCMVWWIKRI
jgi:hypothetical protein